MTEGNGHQIDPAGAARRALQAAVAEHGREVLWNPAVLDGFLQNQLAQLPGEYVLIGSAARANVPALLRDRVGAQGIDGAIQSVAATLSTMYALNLAGCEWVVREFAQILGYGSPVTVPSPPRRRRIDHNLLGVGVAAALVGAYLAVAAIAHLAPFGAGPSPRVSPPVSTGSSPVVAADASPDTSPDAAPDPAADASPTSPFSTLANLIPENIQSTSSCRDYGTPWGSAAAIECSGVPGLSGGSLYYYLYSDIGALNQGYDSFLNGAAFPYSCLTNNSFQQFVKSCQSRYKDDSTGMTGVVSEYFDKDNEPSISTTDEQQLVMAVMISPNAGDALTFWDSSDWIVPPS